MTIFLRLLSESNKAAVQEVCYRARSGGDSQDRFLSLGLDGERGLLPGAALTSGMWAMFAVLSSASIYSMRKRRCR